MFFVCSFGGGEYIFDKKGKVKKKGKNAGRERNDFTQSNQRIVSGRALQSRGAKRSALCVPVFYRAAGGRIGRATFLSCRSEIHRYPLCRSGERRILSVSVARRTILFGIDPFPRIGKKPKNTSFFLGGGTRRFARRGVRRGHGIPHYANLVKKC